MIISYYGTEYFKVQLGDLVVAMNPFAKKRNGGATARFGADIALIQLNDESFNAVEMLSYGGKEPFVVTGPGAYEVRGVPIDGVGAETTYGGTEQKYTTIFSFTLEGLRLCSLAAVDTPDRLSGQVREHIGEVDILFVPCGGGPVLGPSAAHKLAVSFNPKLILPMHYGEDGSKELAQFLGEAGSTAKPEEKLTLKKKDLDSKEGAVAVLKQQ